MIFQELLRDLKHWCDKDALIPMFQPSLLSQCLCKLEKPCHYCSSPSFFNLNGNYIPRTRRNSPLDMALECCSPALEGRGRDSLMMMAYAKLCPKRPEVSLCFAVWIKIQELDVVAFWLYASYSPHDSSPSTSDPIFFLLWSFSPTSKMGLCEGARLVLVVQNSKSKQQEGTLRNDTWTYVCPLTSFKYLSPALHFYMLYSLVYSVFSSVFWISLLYPVIIPTPTFLQEQQENKRLWMGDRVVCENIIF